VAIADIVRRGSIARGTIGGGIAVGTDAAIVMTETVTGLRSTGEGRGPETVSRIASARTGIALARVQGNTEDIDRGAKSDAVMKTASEDHETTIAMPKERTVPSVKRGVDPTAAEADRGRHTSTQDHAERGGMQNSAFIQSSIAITSKPEGFPIDSIAIPPTAQSGMLHGSHPTVKAKPQNACIDQSFEKGSGHFSLMFRCSRASNHCTCRRSPNSTRPPVQSNPCRRLSHSYRLWKDLSIEACNTNRHYITNQTRPDQTRPHQIELRCQA
jgi:hypothetical protein